MTWNYRVVRTEYATPDGGSEAVYAIHEVYYDDEDDGRIEVWSVDPIAPQGSDLGELQWDLRAMLLALDSPVLDRADLPGEKEEG